MKNETLTRELAAIAEGYTGDIAADTFATVSAADSFDAIAGEAAARAEALRDMLTAHAKIIAAHVAAGRGRQAELARSVVGDDAGKTEQNTATKRIGRIAAVGRLMVSHPRADVLALYTFANAATKADVDAAIEGKGDPTKAPKPKRGPGKETGQEKAPKSFHDQLVAWTGTTKALTDRALADASDADRETYRKALVANLRRVSEALGQDVQVMVKSA